MRCDFEKGELTDNPLNTRTSAADCLKLTFKVGI